MQISKDAVIDKKHKHKKKDEEKGQDVSPLGIERNNETLPFFFRQVQ